MNSEYGSVSNTIIDIYEKKYDSPILEALIAIIENIKYHSSRQPKENRQKYFLESCYAHGFSDEDTRMLWEKILFQIDF